VPHEAVFFFLHYFQVGYGGVQFRVPVHQTFAAIDQTFVEQTHKCCGDGTRQASSMVKRSRDQSGEVPRRAFVCDGVAGIFFPLPHFFDELFRPRSWREMPCESSWRSTTIWVAIPAWSVPVAKACCHRAYVITRERVHQGLVEAMPHVQRAGDVWRGNWMQKDSVLC